jgi:hypothetical protein
MQSQTFELVLTAREGISHHDPTTGKDSNTLTFNRQKQFVSRKPTDTPVFRHLVDAICEQNPMPETIAGLTSRLSAPEWLSVAYIRLLLDIHNRGDGEGLLAGMERYRMLENRLQTAAARCYTLHRLWAILTDDLQLGVHPAQWDAQIAAFWTLPPSIQYQMLATMTEQYRAVVTLARVWHTKNKEQSAEYMERAGKLDLFQEEEKTTAHFTDEHFPEPPEQIVLDVPAISVNSIRHQLVREPAWLHLCDALGIEPAARGEAEPPVHADSIFSNGGNIKAGATQPSNAFFLGGQIRKAYPSLDLLGGTTESFDLGESKLKASAWIVCKENADALPVSLQETAQAQTSVFEMLDNVTRTRMATPEGEGQMIYNYETLVKGTQVYVELTLTPYTTDLTRGALAAALRYYADNDNVIGGQSARGHGHVTVEWLGETPDGIAEYEAYLAEHKDQLLAGIVDGTLCSSATVVR